MMVAVERGSRPGRLRAVVAVVIAIAAVAAAFTPWLPRGPDVYQHVVWGWEVMRCLAAWQLPLWLPDLNAGFGNPGIRLYSPLGPVLTGSLGIALADAGRGLRAAAILAALAVMWAARRRSGLRRAMVGAAILVSPMVLFSLLGRAAWSEFLSIPLMLWLLLGMVGDELDATRDGVALALLWLMHAPTTIMVGSIGAASLVLHRSLDSTARFLQTVLIGCGLTAWHWIPLLRETADIAAAKVMTGGMYEPARNYLGSASAHEPNINAWLGWVAVGLLVAVLATRLWAFHPRATVLAVGCVLLASPLALPLWSIPGPHRLLQFPWRWILPATLLLVPALIGTRSRRGLGMACVFAPVLFLPWAPWARVPRLEASMGWHETGRVLMRSIGANPFLVDVRQHRPPAFAELDRNLGLFGHSRLVSVTGGAEITRIDRWSPLLRQVEVSGSQPFVAAFRILDYPYWSVTTGSGRSAETGPVPGVISCQLPAGRHVVRIEWAGNPVAAIGQILALLTVLAMWYRRRIGTKP